MQARFRIHSLFGALLGTGLSIIVIQDLLRDSMYWLCVTTLGLVLLDSLITRLTNRLPVFQSGFRAATLGMVWSGVCVGIAASVRSGLVVGIFGAMLGTAIGFLIAIVPVSLIALIPGQKLHYLGERNSPSDKTVSSITPYMGGQGG